jgi:hypothetical protein
VKAGISTSTAAAVAARKVASKARTAQKLKAELGPFSGREIDLIRRCLKVGYVRGFTAGYRRAQKVKAA